MAINQAFPILDGIAPSWADMSVKAVPSGVAIFDMADIAALNTGTTVEVGEQRGLSGGRVLKRTTGSQSHETSITFYRSGYQKALRNLKALAPLRGNQRAISLVHFDMIVQHTPPNDVEIYEYRLKGVRLLGRSMAHAEGTDADKVEVPCSIAELVDMIDGEEVSFL